VTNPLTGNRTSRFQFFFFAGRHLFPRDFN